ncbi:methylmalonyl Co-A mutase-associated GTPase MeaB [Albibacterium bauzanense]|uniref:LAO/AO transport system kinase n=1 Tax=Albibacterium bauzanense TaxID=653929 RepID=A0A4V2PXR0_9SPHI|nr:methylmalonyl Co-A mutase-associated GTPase MeaB [Albibacterium bauzanense]TCK83011.1 LAO/AO transport system kinase [Albibacterium bauzanense]
MQQDVSTLIEQLKAGDYRALARIISLVENEHPSATEILFSLQPNQNIPIIGITGPPGAGKSTLVNAIAEEFSKEGKRVAILAIDPSSPFNRGSLLGDRIRMNAQFNNPDIYIRSVASRGALGGLSEKTIEITDVLRAAPFDIILVETVGVGQSEIDIIGLADQTIVVLVPESGDEIQHVKSGLMEIADIYVVNKADREGADIFASKLERMLKMKHLDIPVLKIIADRSIGVQNLLQLITSRSSSPNRILNINLLAEKAWRLIQQKRMKDVDKIALKQQLLEQRKDSFFNLYRFVNDNY